MVSTVELIGEDGDTIDDEKIVKARIEMFWDDLFCINGDAIHGRKKEIIWWNEKWSRVYL